MTIGIFFQRADTAAKYARKAPGGCVVSHHGAPLLGHRFDVIFCQKPGGDESKRWINEELRLKLSSPTAQIFFFKPDYAADCRACEGKGHLVYHVDLGRQARDVQEECDACAGTGRAAA